MAAGKVLIMAGGTGGHVYPALAVARYLKLKDVNCFWLGTRAGLEASIVPAAGFDLHCISITGLRGKGVLTVMLAPVRIVRAVMQALTVMRKLQPDVVLGMGGFASGPGGIAAWLSRIPLLIHEQNAISGMTNRLLSHFARTILQAFPGAFPQRANLLTVGNPVRTDLIDTPDPEQRFEGRSGVLRLLVMGGSLGAVALNEIVPLALAAIPADKRPEVYHQCGRGKDEKTSAVYRSAGVVAEVVPFIDDVAERYCWADLVICRSGALTVAELAAVGVGSVLVPYPHAVDDHQTVNARYLSEHDAAFLLPQEQMSVSALLDVLAPLVDDAVQGRRKLLALAAAARSRAITDATEKVAECCQRYIAPTSGVSISGGLS